MDHPELFMKELSELPETGGGDVWRLRIARFVDLRTASNPRQENFRNRIMSCAFPDTNQKGSNVCVVQVCFMC